MAVYCIHIYFERRYARRSAITSCNNLWAIWKAPIGSSFFVSYVLFLCIYKWKRNLWKHVHFLGSCIPFPLVSVLMKKLEDGSSKQWFAWSMSSIKRKCWLSFLNFLSELYNISELFFFCKCCSVSRLVLLTTVLAPTCEKAHGKSQILLP